MITKERLEELIKEKATIYILVKELFIAGTSSFINIIELPLKNYHGISVEKYNKINNCKPHLYQGGEFMPYEKVAELEECFETKEDARWELEMTATRTETLKMPPFIEVCDGCIYDITFIDNKKCKWQLTISDNGIALLDFALLGRDKFWNKLTKENYIDACKLCLRLFKGEEA